MSDLSLSVLRPAQRSGARRAGYQVKHTGVTRGAMLLYCVDWRAFREVKWWRLVPGGKGKNH